MRVGELAELLVDLVELVLLLGDLEQRVGVYAGDLLHRPSSAPPIAPLPARAEKSTSASASSTSRFWSSSSSDLRVTFSVASTVRSATSLRICSSERLRLGLDVPAGRGDQLLALGLALGGRLGDRGLGRLARAGDDVVGLLARLLQPLAVLGEQLVGLLALLLGGLDVLPDRVRALLERLADPREGELPEHEHRDPEQDQRPDHQPEARARPGSCRPPPRRRAAGPSRLCASSSIAA